MTQPDPTAQLDFDQADLLPRIAAVDEAGLDQLRFGLIGFDGECRVRRYNAVEASFSGLQPSAVLGLLLFSELAQCMNNFMVAQRFEDALAAGEQLDAIIDYVLTWRMRPTRVRLRLLAEPSSALSYVLLQHAARPGP